MLLYYHSKFQDFTGSYVFLHIIMLFIFYETPILNSAVLTKTIRSKR